MQQPRPTIANFGHNVKFSPQRSIQPNSVEELLEMLADCRDRRIRVTGRLHSWSQVIVAEDVHLDLSRLDSIELKQFDGKPQVTVGPGCQMKKLLAELHEHGLTLPSVGLIDEQSLAGATATGTHGSGKHSLSHYLDSVDIVHFDDAGAPVISTISSGSELKAARCSLGLLGIIVNLRLTCRSAYHVKEHTERYRSLKKVLEAEKRFPLQQFYLMPWSWDYYGHHRVESNEPKSKSAFWYRVYWSLLIDYGLHILIFILARIIAWPRLIRSFFKYLLPLTIVRNWNVVDDSHKMLTMEHELFRHIEIELFVTRSRLKDAIDYVIDAIAVCGGLDAPSGNGRRAAELSPVRGSYCHHYPICVRRVLSDDTLLSMSAPHATGGDEDWYAISLISYQGPRHRDGFYQFATTIAVAMAAQFDARPHWGKFHPLSASQIKKLYPRLDEFNSIRVKFDPDNRFGNDWLDELIPLNATCKRGS